VSARPHVESVTLSRRDAAERHNRVLLAALQKAQKIVCAGRAGLIRELSIHPVGGALETDVYLAGSRDPVPATDVSLQVADPLTPEASNFQTGDAGAAREAHAQHNRVLLHALHTDREVVYQDRYFFIHSLTFAAAVDRIECTVYLSGRADRWLAGELLTLSPPEPE
jgi:hypothetical protein